jgi:hypothetical protein
MCIIQIPTISGIHSLRCLQQRNVVVVNNDDSGILTTWSIALAKSIKRGVSKATAMATFPSP